MKLYDSRPTPSARRVRMFLAEKELEIPRVAVDLAAGEHRSPEFLARNPLGEVPVLELDDGSCLTESLAICRYLEALHPEPRLLGRSPREQAEVDMRTLQVAIRLYAAIRDAFRHTHAFWAGRLPQVPAYGAIAREAALRELEWLDGLLASRPFVAGEAFSLADIVAFTTVDFGRVADIRIQPGQPHLVRWYGEIGARPSARA